MSFFDRVASLFSSGDHGDASHSSSGSFGDANSSAEPPHLLRQHFAVSTREVQGFEVYSLAPMKFAETNATDVTSYDPHADALEELSPADAATKAVLYVLPGGFAKPIQPRNWDFIAQLAEANLRVEIPLYGLVPNFACTDSIPLLAEVYSQLVEDHGAENVTIIADSAGGSLALGTLIASHFYPEVLGTTGERTNLPLLSPGRMILNAPWVDMDLSNPDVVNYTHKDPLLDPAQLRPQGNLWAQGLTHNGITEPGSATPHPTVSPINLPETSWPKVLRGTEVHIFCGDRDISFPDATSLADILNSQSIDATFHPQHGGIHMYHLTKSREGRAARKMMVSVACATPNKKN